VISKSLKWKFLAVNGWMIFFGAVIGWSGPTFPWGVLAVAVGLTLLAVSTSLRDRDRS
jgi:hypothetical protein